MLKKIGRILLGVLLISLMVACCIFIVNNNKKNSTAKSGGEIQAVVNNKDNEIVYNRMVSFNEDDTLYEVINREFNIVCSDTAYGHFMLEIEDIKTDGKTSWLWFETAYIDEEQSTDKITAHKFTKVLTGIDGIRLEDGMIFGINERDSTHASSIIDQNLTIEDNSNKVDYFRISAYIIIGLFFVGIIVYFVVNKKKEKITVKELAILSLMTVIVFVQEELLSILPNIQLTFLLFAVYVVVFGYRRTTMIVIAHVLLDNMIMGSLTPIVMIPMLIGYLIYISLIAVVKNQKLWVITVFASIGSLIYCYLFLIANAIFLDIDVFAYWIADIPFEILLVLSTIFTIVYLYNPLSKKLKELWTGETNEYDTLYEE